MPFNIQFSKSNVPSQVRKDKMYTLTQLGRQQVDTLEGDEVEFSILATMATRRAWSMDDISKEARISIDKVQHELKTLMSKGFVKTIGAQGD